MVESKVSYRTDKHNNPTAFTTDLAKQAGLQINVDYVRGDPFPNNQDMFTAKLLGDPIQLTINLIDRVGFTTKSGAQRWIYMYPEMNVAWKWLPRQGKKAIIQYMYHHEGGTELEKLFV